MNLIVEKTRKNDVSNTNGVICLSARNATVHRFAKRASAVADDIGLRAAVRGSHFWAIAVALFLVAGSVNGSIAHIVPLLANRGVSTQAATAALSSAGLALILGRILSGYCLDRLFAPFVSATFFLVPLCGILLLGSGTNTALALFAAILLGIGIGAEVDIMAFLVGHYFGLSSYGRIYGTLRAIHSLQREYVRPAV
jgi:predicted MFS family arabinose efflux permease